jgi:hypothetical protein
MPTRLTSTANRETQAPDKVIANSVTINGASFSLADSGSATLPAGATLTVIESAAAPPISGTFANLADGGALSLRNSNFQADYEGGDGNDLTLTVVP